MKKTMTFSPCSIAPRARSNVVWCSGSELPPRHGQECQQTRARSLIAGFRRAPDTRDQQFHHFPHLANGDPFRVGGRQPRSQLRRK